MPLQKVRGECLTGRFQNGRRAVQGPDGSKVNIWVEPSKWAHLKGIGVLFHKKLQKNFFLKFCRQKGRYGSAITRKHKNKHKIKTKACTRLNEGSIPMFLRSGNSIMKLFRSNFGLLSFYMPLWFLLWPSTIQQNEERRHKTQTRAHIRVI